MEKYLQDLLLASVPFPVAWGTLDSGAGAPYVSMHRLSGRAEWSMDGPGPTRGRIQVDAFGRTFAEAQGAADAVLALLDGHSGGPVQGMFLDAVRDGADGAQGTKTVLLQRISLIFSITYVK
ncbi:hypothetical protein BYZ73_19885 [Rhodovulum viride]|uniref:DUF3168 domain-containing protein n=1 Tax=Rhodovulum viride TaxID=1231134 RepID=A0ABX9DB52_9RHOB|nr:hypothetical protein [Rhodovulum viride]RAP39567.1 hypothetical protein BYZ73_19885 [Rhodovulum viride]